MSKTSSDLARTKIQRWWTDNVRAWFAEQLSRQDISTGGASRLTRLATDSRTELVASRLKKEERRHPGSSVRFLMAALEAPHFWNSLKGRSGRVRRQNLAQLSTACTALSKLLTANEYMAHVAIFLYGNESVDGRSPTERFDSMIDTINAVGRAAAENEDFDDRPGVDVLPRKMNYRRAEEVFCARHLVAEARRLFARPLYEEVATTIEVMFQLKADEISAQRVKELTKSTGKGGDSSIDF